VTSTTLSRDAAPAGALDAGEFAALADNLPQLAWIADAEGWIYWYNRRWYEYTGTTAPEMQGWGWQSVHDPAVLPQVLERWSAAIAAGEPFDMVFPLRGRDGAFRSFLTRVQPWRDPNGKVARWFGTNTDISEQQAVSDALAEEKRLLETLNRTAALVGAELDLEKLVQIVTDAGVALTGAQFGAFFYNLVNERGESYTLYTISGVPRENFSKFPMPRNTHVFEPTFRGAGVVRSDDITKDPRYGKLAPHYGMPEGHLPVCSYLAVPVISRSGEVLGGLFFGHAAPARFTSRHEELLVGIAGQAAIGIDNARLYQEAQREIAERREAEQHRRLLMNELNHRVKNTLATVQSIAAQTLRSSALEASVRETFDARLIALSNAHNLLMSENWKGATLAEVVAAALAPYRAAGADRFAVSGPEVPLSAKTALALSMALHELAANAGKYGALSDDAGRVALAWEAEGREGDARLRIRWAERGGPPATPPQRKGFGSRLIERGLAAELGGTARLAFEPGGLVCTIEAPMPRVGDAGEGDQP
jgi:PAS domain S-box-containing protein